jgi:hypothetical protein
MTTAGHIKEKLESGEWTALEAAEGFLRACGDKPAVDGVTPSWKDPDTWALMGLLCEQAGLSVAKLIGVVKAFL